MAGISDANKTLLNKGMSILHKTQLGTILSDQLPPLDFPAASADGFVKYDTASTAMETRTYATTADIANVTKAAESAGTALTIARGDHKHDVSTAAPSTALSSSTTNAEGSATTLARSDHSHTVTGCPTSDEKAALAGTGTPSGSNKYVTNDTLLSTVRNLDFKNSVRMATAAALPACTAAGTGVGKTLTGDAVGQLADIDGVTPVAGDRILVKNQVAGKDNGIYEVTVLGDGGTAFVLTRATDADADAEVTSGLAVHVNEGTTQADQDFYLTTNDPITLDTTALTFAINDRLPTANEKAGLSANSPTAANPVTTLTEEQELTVKIPVRMATTAALPACTPSGTGVTHILTGDAVGQLADQDGITPVQGNRLLVKNQVAADDNGIYTVTTLGDGGTAFVLTRATDANTDTKVVSGIKCYVESGTANAKKTYVLTTANPITLDTTAIAFEEEGVNAINTIRAENTDGKIPGHVADAHAVSGAWTVDYNATTHSHEVTRGAAAASEVCAFPLRVPGLRTTSGKGRKLTGVRIAYQNSGELAVDFDVDVFKRPLPANGANAHSNGTSLKGSATYDADHDSAAKRKATGNHCMEVTFETPAYLTGGGEVSIEATANDTGGAGTATTTISGVELIYSETLVD